MKERTLIAILATLSLLILILLGLLTGITEFFPEILIFITLTWFFWYTYDVFRLNAPTYTLLIIGFLLHSFGIFGWYHTSPIPIQWDHITHYFSMLPFALLFFKWLEQWMDAKLFTTKNLIIIMSVFLLVSGVGALIELSEFLGYLKFGFGDGAFRFGPGDSVATDAMDVVGGGWINTGWDLIYNTLGAITGILFMLIIRALRKKPRSAYYFENVGEWSRRIT